MRRRVGIRCDAGPGVGVGHLVRCVALAEELGARGIEVVFLGDLGGLSWAAAQLQRRGLPLVPARPGPEALGAQAAALGLDSVVLDSYELPPETGMALRRAGIPVLAIIDGDTRGQSADLYLDQNLGAEDRHVGLPVLAGTRYVLLRDDVRRYRSVPAGGIPHVLCFFGGTDATGVTVGWLDALAETGVPFSATVIAPGPVAPPPGLPISVLPPTDELPRLMAQADLVITAAGTTVWELLYLGVPTALTWVRENQLLGYHAVTKRGLAAGLGAGNDPRSAVPTLRDLLADPGRRARYARRGRKVIDGLGRERAADALARIR
ncbi:glycosyltransferase [Spongiactinospora sp. TRM90649]|uniref:PseG/SpsG family protein n=1 Tax=Spongiactinospora sp. TRM90649 TaxID=3031114 RepID=UPI0023F651F7|nr:glycosyltransferase [Spongiactinospora sp. TRM90649]MDF5751398.1 glycosyltransferase [Spongiactinospora sp. TRM90649]